MFSLLLLIVVGSSSMIFAGPVPAAQSWGSTSYDLPSDSAGGPGAIAAPNFDVPFPNNFFTPPQPKNPLLAAADYTTPQPDTLLLTDYTTPQSDSLLLANTEDPKAVEICRSQGSCGLLGNPIPTPPDLSPPLTPDLQWLNDKKSQSMTTEFVNFKCGGTQSVCCQNWHRTPAQQSGSQTPYSNKNSWLSCSNSIPHSLSQSQPLPQAWLTRFFNFLFTEQLVVSAGSPGTVPDLNFVCIQPKYYHDCDTLQQSLEVCPSFPLAPLSSKANEAGEI